LNAAVLSQYNAHDGDGVRLNRSGLDRPRADNSCTGAAGREHYVQNPAGHFLSGDFFWTGSENFMNKMAWVWLGVAFFGALGSVARFGVSQISALVTNYPAGTLAVNVLGAFLLGWVHSALTGPTDGAANFWRIVLGVGFLGGFTTFSSMMLDADNMMIPNSHYLRAAAYLAASLFLGLAAVRLGAIVGKI
jgi:CrcB protein